MTPTVRTRFAPSPTGYLHVGGARTALFNYLLARQSGGVFILRIEDTDQTRNIAGAEQKLLDDLRWLGLPWDEGPGVGGDCGPYYQSQRLERYQEQTRRLLDEGQAYYAMETREELDAMRQAAQQRGTGFTYQRPSRFPSESEAQTARDAGRPVVVRLKMPGRDFVVRDEILGDVTIASSELYDFVIQKSDGWPTYHFAVVVDDEDMRVTHVLRGQEHLMNTPNHLALQVALGCATPAYAHLPIILNLDGSKMSKRDKDKAVREAVRAATRSGRLDPRRAGELAGCDEAAFESWMKKKTQLDNDGLARLARELCVELPEIEVHDFRAAGYLPESLLNFLALLGWSPGDDREKFTLDELVAAFRVERIGKSSARFDRAKLLNFNTTAVAACDLERLMAGLRDWLALSPASPLARGDEPALRRTLELCQGFRVFRDVESKARALFVEDEEISYDPTAVEKELLRGEPSGARMLETVRRELAAVDEWRRDELEAALTRFVEQRGLKLGKVAQPLRVAVTGTTISPAIFDTLEMLGKQRVLRRVDRALAHAATSSS